MEYRVVGVQRRDTCTSIRSGKYRRASMWSWRILNLKIGNLEIQESGNLGLWKFENLRTQKYRNFEICEFRILAIRNFGNLKIQKLGNLKIGNLEIQKFENMELQEFRNTYIRKFSTLYRPVAKMTRIPISQLPNSILRNPLNRHQTCSKFS